MCCARARPPSSSTFRRAPRLAGLVLFLAALAGCGDDATEPGSVNGAYTLRLLNGQPLPYDHEGLGCCTYLNGTLRLDGGGYVLALSARNRNTQAVFTATEWGKYTGHASVLTFAPDSFEVQPLGLTNGAVSADSARMAFGGEGPGSPDQFQGLFVRSP